MIRKLILGLFLISFVPFLHAEESEQVIGPFGTLNNRDNSATIADTQAQDLLNVDITPGGKSFKKRRGYALSYALPITTSGVHGVYDFYDASGNNIALAFNDSYMTTSINGGAATVLFSTGPIGATYQCVDSQGFAYCANTTSNMIIKTNGLTQAPFVVTTTGYIIAVGPDRLVQAGFPSALNRIDLSASGDFTNWTTGILPTSPFSFTITAPGSAIKCVTYAFNRYMWFKDNSFGYILPGATAVDWQVKTISPNVGTLDNSFVYWQDILYFRGQDSHIYSYDGSNLVRLSREISGTIAQTQNRRQNNYSQTTQADFALGLSQPLILLDTTTNSGAVQMTFPDYFDLFRDGTNSTKNVWTQFNSGSTTGNVSSSGGLLNFQNNGSNLGRVAVRTTSLLPDFRQGTTYHFLLNFLTKDNANLSRLSLTLRNDITSSNPESGTATMVFLCTTTARINVNNFSISGQSGGVSTSGDYAQPADIDFYISTTAYQLTINGSVALSGTHSATPGNQYLYFAYENTFAFSSTCTIDNFGISPTTATYDSPVVNAPSLSAWDNMTFNGLSVNGGNVSYMRSSTNSFTIASSTPSWTSVGSGSPPTISTGTYFQFRDYFISSTWTARTELDDFTINWFEGSATDKSYMIYFNDSILFSVAYGASATTNNRILKYDMLNQGWLIYDIPSNGFYTKNLALYFGSPLTGNVYKYGDVDSDAGSAINAYWKSKDFIGDDPFKDDEIRNISIFGYAVANSSITATLTINESTSTTLIIPTYRSGATFFSTNRNTTSMTTNSFNMKIGNNAANQYFEIMAERVGTNTKTWHPTNP